MFCSSYLPFSRLSPHQHTTAVVSEKFRNCSKQKVKLGVAEKSICISSPSSALQKSIPFAAASVSILLWSFPVNAGILSGFSGLESMPGPQLPQFDFLTQRNEENQKKYAEFDSRFKSSPMLKELLEKSKSNKEKNRQQIQDKYCIRGAEWGVGDCSTQGMTPEEKDNFISMLKQKSGGD
ncbi:uncharacterized protein LOC131219196 [Magnolia sinica]|uniref:uncharacterized protein LOC131219196 n=1 Tax=Magnolia sinica TaxID=86752 RepID=UPI0026582568|nr:uncharacterized protein LOC131219196 [Magnolia sinica]